MFNNGVSHTTVSWDYEGIAVILRWLSYFPSSKHAPLPILLNTRDTIDRDIAFTPTRTGYDPRNMLCGVKKTGSAHIIFYLL